MLFLSGKHSDELAHIVPLVSSGLRDVVLFFLWKGVRTVSSCKFSFASGSCSLGCFDCSGVGTGCIARTFPCAGVTQSASLPDASLVPRLTVVGQECADRWTFLQSCAQSWYFTDTNVTHK